MSCFHPMIGCKSGINVETGKARVYIYPWNDKLEKEMLNNPDYFPVPCGKCLGCRQDYARQWTDRMIMEMDTTKEAWFVTCTYDDDYVPKVPVVDDNGEVKSWTTTTCKKHMQKFIRKVREEFKPYVHPIHYERKALDPDYPIPGIRYFGATEYGTKSLRPHFHMIIFNLHLEERDLRIYKIKSNGQILYNCDRLSRCWSNFVGIDKHGNYRYDPLGHVVVAKVNANTINYVAQYTNKKACQDLEKYIKEFNLEPPKTLCSVKPGLGWYWFYDHKDLVRDYTGWFIGSDEGSREIRCPEYFYRLYSKIDEEAVQSIKAQKQCVGALAYKRVLETIQKPYSAYMKDKELDTKYRLKRLQGNFNRDKI